MTIHLPPEIESSIQAAVHSGHFESVDALMTKAASMLLQQLEQEQEQAQATTPPAQQREPLPAPKPIWEKFEDIAAGIPNEVWEKIPADSSEQLDHYLYGTPGVRRNEAGIRRRRLLGRPSQPARPMAWASDSGQP